MGSHIFDKAGWAKLDELQQMGNIASEVGRALTAQRQGKTERMQTAFYRGLDLIDETARLWAQAKKPGLKELLYARELFAEAVTTNQQNAWLEDYFVQFATAARLRQF